MKHIELLKQLANLLLWVLLLMTQNSTVMAQLTNHSIAWIGDFGDRFSNNQDFWNTFLYAPNNKHIIEVSIANSMIQPFQNSINSPYIGMGYRRLIWQNKNENFLIYGLGRFTYLDDALGGSSSQKRTILGIQGGAATMYRLQDRTFLESHLLVVFNSDGAFPNGESAFIYLPIKINSFFNFNKTKDNESNSINKTRFRMSHHRFEAFTGLSKNRGYPINIDMDLNFGILIGKYLSVEIISATMSDINANPRFNKFLYGMGVSAFPIDFYKLRPVFGISFEHSFLHEFATQFYNVSSQGYNFTGHAGIEWRINQNLSFNLSYFIPIVKHINYNERFRISPVFYF